MSEKDEILNNDMIRDGGSAWLSVRLQGQKLGVRVMRSFGDQGSSDFGKYEVNRDGEQSVVSSLEEIDGLKELIMSSKNTLKDHVAEYFLNPKVISKRT